jgi:hypothetical protein
MDPTRVPIVIAMARALRILAACASLLLILGFAGFVADESERSSDAQAAKVTRPKAIAAPGPATERERERSQGALAEGIDDGNDVLLSPFSGIIDSSNVWVRRGIPTLLGLLAYGVGLGLLANAVPKPRRATGDWRTAG